MFLEQKISILELFLNDHVTLKTVMMLKILLCITGINYIFEFIKIQKNFFLNNNTQYYNVYCILI